MVRHTCSLPRVARVLVWGQIWTRRHSGGDLGPLQAGASHLASGPLFPHLPSGLWEGKEVVCAQSHMSRCGGSDSL